jgi:hypothetical protein
MDVGYTLLDVDLAGICDSGGRLGLVVVGMLSSFVDLKVSQLIQIQGCNTIVLELASMDYLWRDETELIGHVRYGRADCRCTRKQQEEKDGKERWTSTVSMTNLGSSPAVDRRIYKSNSRY